MLSDLLYLQIWLEEKEGVKHSLTKVTYSIYHLGEVHSEAMNWTITANEFKLHLQN